MYLGSTVRCDGGAGIVVKSCLSKARNAFRMQYSIRTKLKLYQSSVLSTLLYGSECQRMTVRDLNRLSVFHTKSLRQILRIFWSNTISNEQLSSRQHGDQHHEEKVAVVGHVLRKEPGNITHTALHWTPEGKCKRSRLKNTWRRTVEGEMTNLNHTWGTIRKLVQNRQLWKTFVAALHASRHSGH